MPVAGSICLLVRVCLTWFGKEESGSKLEKKASRGVSVSRQMERGSGFDNIPSGSSSEPSSEYDGPHAPGQDWLEG